MAALLLLKKQILIAPIESIDLPKNPLLSDSDCPINEYPCCSPEKIDDVYIDKTGS
jgi:hypothetical protein